MGIKEQFLKIKENWLILVLVLVLLFAMSGNNLVSNTLGGVYTASKGMAVMSESLAYDEGRAFYPAPTAGGDFAPDVAERQITKTSTLSTEVERGTFKDSEASLKNIITSSDSYLLNENVNNYGTQRKSYYSGSYQIKVDSSKYDSVISQLKGIGEVQSFNENALDITARYTNTQTELELAKDKLARYEAMYAEAEKMEDKINLNEMIFNQERTIKYLEDAIKNIAQKVDYSTIYFTMTEKQSEYSNVVFVKFSELIQNFVVSFNALINWIFVLVPWAIAALIVRIVWKRVKKKK
ncbi:MAG: DUF4349 domain-containing protein [Candidatus Woesearchaeota archaeon]